MTLSIYSNYMSKGNRYTEYRFSRPEVFTQSPGLFYGVWLAGLVLNQFNILQMVEVPGVPWTMPITSRACCACALMMNMVECRSINRHQQRQVGCSLYVLKISIVMVGNAGACMTVAIGACPENIMLLLLCHKQRLCSDDGLQGSKRLVLLVLYETLGVDDGLAMTMWMANCSATVAMSCW